jgi:hypothetical protein
MDPRIRIHTKISWIRNTAVRDLNFLLVLFRALNCLFSIANEAEIVKVTGQSVGELKQYMRNLMFLAR